MSQQEDLNEVRIYPRTGFSFPDLREISQYKSLMFLLVWREIKSRYKQSYLGALWVIFQPLTMMSVYALFLGYVARFPSEGVPYAVYILCSITCWQFFNQSMTGAGTSLANQQALIGKIYFPRILAPMSASLSSFLDLAILIGLLVVVMAFFGIFPSPNAFMAVGILILIGFFAFSLGLALTVLDAFWRDVRHGLGLVIQIWYFASPVIYPVTLVPERFLHFYYMNPMAPLIQGFRWAVLGGDVSMPPLWSFGSSICVILIAFVIGLTVFQRLERNVVDYL